MTDISIETEAEIELSPREMSELIGDQFIIEGEYKPFSYLAGLSFDGMTSDYDIVDILIEYLENARAFEHLDDDDIAEIESILRE